MSVCLTNQKKKSKKNREKNLICCYFQFFSFAFFFVHLSNLFQRKQPNFLINLSNLIDILKESVDLKEEGKQNTRKRKLQLKIN